MLLSFDFDNRTESDDSCIPFKTKKRKVFSHLIGMLSVDFYEFYIDVRENYLISDALENYDRFQKKYDVDFSPAFYQLLLEDKSDPQEVIMVNLVAAEMKKRYIVGRVPYSLYDFYTFFIGAIIPGISIIDLDPKSYTSVELEAAIGETESIYGKVLSGAIFNKPPTEIMAAYICEKVLDVLICSLYEAARNNIHIQACANCGEIFVLNKADEKYCTRISPQYSSMDCKAAAKYIKQLKREDKDQAYRIYKSRYNSLRKKIDNACYDPKKEEKYKKEFEEFKVKAEDFREKIAKNPTEELVNEFIEWMNTYKTRKKK
jgi:hypothetical protein